MNTYSALRPSATNCISPGGEYGPEARVVMAQMFPGALTPAA